MGGIIVALKITARSVFGNFIWGVGSAPAGRDKVYAGFLKLVLAYTAPKRTTVQWTVPLQLGVIQLVQVAGRLLQVGGLVRYYAEAPQGGPDWGFQIRVTLIFPK